MGLLVQDRRRDKLLTNVQNFSIAGTTMPSAWVKVEYDLHTHGVIVIKPSPPYEHCVYAPGPCPCTRTTRAQEAHTHAPCTLHLQDCILIYTTGHIIVLLMTFT